MNMPLDYQENSECFSSTIFLGVPRSCNVVLLSSSIHLVKRLGILRNVESGIGTKVQRFSKVRKFKHFLLPMENRRIW